MGVRQRGAPQGESRPPSAKEEGLRDTYVDACLTPWKIKVGFEGTNISSSKSFFSRGIGSKNAGKASPFKIKLSIMMINKLLIEIFLNIVYHK